MRPTYEIRTRVKESGGIVGVHCEEPRNHPGETEGSAGRKGNRKDVSDYPGTRPAAEAEAVNRFLAIARCVDAPAIVVHLSTAEGYEVIRTREGEMVRLFTSRPAHNTF